MKCSSSTSGDSSSTLPSTSTHYKRSRVRLQAFQKQQVVLMLNSGVSVRRTAEQFGIGQTTVRDIRRRSSELQPLVPTPSLTFTSSSASLTSAHTSGTYPSPLTSTLSTVLESEPADFTTLPSSPTRLGETSSIPHHAPASATVKLEPTDPDSAPAYSIDATLEAAEELFERLSQEPSVPYHDLLKFSSILRKLKSGEEQSSARTRQTSIESFFKRT